MVIKNDYITNWLLKWKDAPRQKLNRDIIDKELLKYMVGLRPVKPYLRYFDKFRKSGAVNAVVVANPLQIKFIRNGNQRKWKKIIRR